MRQLIRDTCALAAEIMDGHHDDNLDFISQAVQARKRNMFRPGAQVRLVGTRNPKLEGQLGTVIKCNPRTVVVGVGVGVRCEPTAATGYRDWSVGEFNVSPSLLELV